MIFGADVSEWQGSPAVHALALAPLAFYMIRTEDGAHVDGKFSAYCMAFNAAGIYDLGTYFYFRAHLPVVDQVRRAVDMHGDLWGPLAVDMETLDNVSPQAAADATQQALELVTAQSGRVPLLYTDAGDWSKLGAWGKQHHFERYPLWLAAVTENPDRDVPAPPGLGRVVMRQYTFGRTVPGFSGKVDGDVFLGTIDEWRNVGREPFADTDPPTA